MAHLMEIQPGAQPPERFKTLLGEDHVHGAVQASTAIRERFAGRVLWNVSSTAMTSGVAERVQSFLSYARGSGIDARWLVIRAGRDFFRITKRLHHALYGSPGDGSDLEQHERSIYEATLRENALELCSLVRSRDVVLLHGPQTLGIAPYLLRRRALVIWCSESGHDSPNEQVWLGWNFLAPYLEFVAALVLPRDVYVAPEFTREKAALVRPTLDPFSLKNQELDEATVQGILVHVGLLEGPPPTGASPCFRRTDGSPGRVERHADVTRLGQAPAWDTPLVVQISRWDILKDHLGVLRGFAALVSGSAPTNAELVLAGPNVNAVADDPEAASVFEQVLDAWYRLPHAVRNRVHLATLPTSDAEEQAVIVNALQRRASVIVQKSLRDGFGLTVTEAMWKSRPVVASAAGGIADQIEDGVHGLLLKEPTDLDAFAALLRRVLEDPPHARRLGHAAHARVREHYVGLQGFVELARLLERLDR